MFYSLAMTHYLSCKQEKIIQRKLCANHNGLAHTFARASYFLYDCRSQRSCMSTRWWLSTPVRPGRPTVLSAPSCSGILLAEFMAVHIHFNLTLFSSQILFMDFLSAKLRCTRQGSISFTPPPFKSFRVPVTLFQLSRGTVQRCAWLERVWTTTCVIPHHHCCKDLH